MTTVAYRDGVMAGEGQVTLAEMVVSSDTRKVHRLKDGRLFGWAGTAAQSEVLIASLRKGGATPDCENITALLVSPDGSTVSYYEGGVWRVEREKYNALGSGSAFALGAMDHGATAAEAVKIASKRDVSSGGKVRTVKLKDYK
jgi:ATP-dependent protease HslVU (ClpYQ) peptidase subunit